MISQPSPARRWLASAVPALWLFSDKGDESTSREKPRLLASALADPKQVVLLFAAYTYVSGFVFSYYYHAYFGLSFSASEVPIYNLFIYSLNSFALSPTLSIATALLVLAVVAHGWVMTHSRAVDALLVLLFLSFIPLVLYTSAEAAERAASRVRTGDSVLPGVQLKLKPEAEPAYQAMVGWAPAVEAGGLQLLAQNKQAYFLLFQPIAPGDAALPASRVFTIKKSDVSAFQTIIYKRI